MFDPDLFQSTLDQAIDALESLILPIRRRFGTILLPISMNGRGIPKTSRSTLLKLLESSEASSHEKIVFIDAIDSKLPGLIRDLRRSFADAAGGLDKSNWCNAHLLFTLANGGSVAMELIIPSLHETMEKQRINFSLSTRSQDFAQRLHLHSRLDLSGPPHRFEIFDNKKNFSPYTVDAPSPVDAVRRLSVILDKPLDTWKAIRQIHDPAAVLSQARQHHAFA